MFYVYIIQNDNNALYYGSTNDLRRRMKEHNSGKSYSTRGHVWRFVYYESFTSEIDAREREKQLKRHGQAKAQLRRRIRRSISKVSAG